jgi:hypothetical protein
MDLLAVIEKRQLPWFPMAPKKKSRLITNPSAQWRIN